MIQIERATLGFSDHITVWPLTGLVYIIIKPWGGNGIFETGYDYRSIYMKFIFVNFDVILKRSNGKEPDDLDMV